uniref:Uncharacterized protein n=1 Tax=Setaria italica TaxID=4555 RepID=K3ZFW1_SETIT
MHPGVFCKDLQRGIVAESRTRSRRMDARGLAV